MVSTMVTTARKRRMYDQNNGSEQEFDRVPDWRVFREFSLPGNFDGSVGPLVNVPVSRRVAETEAVPSRQVVFPASDSRLRSPWNIMIR